MWSFANDGNLPKVEIHVTEVCNNRCSFCTTGWINAERSDDLVHVPRATVRDQLAKAFAHGARRALFQGGEPTVRRDLGDLVADARTMGYEATTVFTNGRMAASRAGARWLASMGVTWFQVSVQGGHATAHDRSVGAKGAFEQTVTGARRLIAMGQRVKINAVLTRDLLDSLGEFADLMIDLGPEEVGMDTVKPTGAFGPQRESYTALCPPLGPHAAAIRDTVLRMDQAGVIVRLTSFPACLVAGAEHLVSEESPTTITYQASGTAVHKTLWKREMQIKSEDCRRCAYDPVCGGVYAPYAEAYGLLELRPLAVRRAPGPPSAAAHDTALTRALRDYFMRPQRGPFGVRRVRRLPDGSHELDCFGPRGELQVAVFARGRGPAYATTEEFAVAYRNSDAAPDGRMDARLVDGVVRALRRIEERLLPDLGPPELACSEDSEDLLTSRGGSL